MKIYILKNREQVVCDMEQEDIMRFCEEHGLSVFYIESSFMTNDWNWLRQYPNTLYICAKDEKTARDFVVRGFYHSKEYDGDDGVIFRCLQTLYVGGAMACAM